MKFIPKLSLNLQKYSKRFRDASAPRLNANGSDINTFGNQEDGGAAKVNERQFKVKQNTLDHNSITTNDSRKQNDDITTTAITFAASVRTTNNNGYNLNVGDHRKCDDEKPENAVQFSRTLPSNTKTPSTATASAVNMCASDFDPSPTAAERPSVISDVVNFENCNRIIELQRLEEFVEHRKPKFLAKSTKQDLMFNGSFHEAFSRVLLVAELFAIMPVKGVTSSHPRYLSFSWSNIRTWYCVVFIVLTIIDLGLTMYKVLHRSITFNTIEPIIFRVCIIVVCMGALDLSRKWPNLMVYWDKVERDLPSYHTQLDKRRMASQIRLVTYVGMMLSMGEHLMSLISIIHYSNFCSSTDDPIKNFFLMAHDEIFYVFEFSYWLAWLAKVQNVLSTFIWNYMDVFVMVISIALTSKFKQINDNLMQFKGMQMPECFWSARRIQYRNLCMLCEEIDKAISLITMVSFSNNLYFICVQLLKSLNKMPSTAHALYFYYSLSFLIGRTLAVSLYSASVNDESRKPLRVLRCVPKESWCAEVKRFAEEINSDVVALSGMKFFHLTRKLVLSVAGTIVTYELVLIQFHEDNPVWDCKADFGFNGTNGTS